MNILFIDGINKFTTQLTCSPCLVYFKTYLLCNLAQRPLGVVIGTIGLDTSIIEHIDEIVTHLNLFSITKLIAEL